MSTSKVEFFPLLGAGLQKLSTTAESIAAATLDPTGFEDPDNIGVSYSHTDRKITLTHSSGTIAWWWRGTRYTTSSPWVSAAHDAPVGSYWLTFAGAVGTASWAGSAWTFDKIQVAMAYYQALPADSYAMRETHGLMPWQAHENDHLAIGTYKKSGLALAAASYATSGTTDAENAWGVDSGVIQDEDLETTIAAWSEGTYTVLYRNGVSGTWVFDTTKTLPFHVVANTIQYNQLTGGAWQLTPVTEDNFVNYYVVAVPTTSDADSQKHRIWVIPGQSIYTSSTAAQQEFPSNLDLGTLTSLAAEFVFCVRVTMRYNASGAGALATTGRCNIAAVANLTGTRLSQVASAPFSPADHGSLSGLGDDDHTQYELITGRASNVVTKNTDFTIDSGVIIYCVDTSGGNKTVTLLDPTTVPGKLVTFLNTSTNNIIFDSYAIGGISNFTIDGNERLQIVSDGTAWKQYARKMMATWKTGITFCKDQIIEVSESGYEGIWRCITQHTAAAAFATDVAANWDYMGGSRSARWIYSAGHGFSEGNWLYDTGAAWALADCDAAATAEVIGVVSRATTNYFLLVTNGYLKRSSTPYTRGAVQFLSGTAGASTETEPSTVGQISKPLGVAISTSEMEVNIMRGTTVGGTNLYTTISLANNATTTIQDVSGHTAGTGGYIEGYIVIDGGAGEDAVTTFKVEFQKPASGTAYSCTVTYGCEALFAGSSIDITTGGLIQVTLADIGGDFVSASATFCMQAAAIGAQLPLQIDSSLITFQEPTMFRNRIINGKMTVAQRGTSFVSPVNNTYLLDRFYCTFSTAAVVTITQDTEVPFSAFTKSLKIDVTTADGTIAASDYFSIVQKIEGDSVTDLIGNPFILSFWVKSPKTGVHSVAFKNSGSDRSYISEYSITSANTWEYKTISVSGGLITAGTWDWTTGIGLQVVFTLACGSTYQTTADAWQTGNYIATASQVNCLDDTANNFYLTGVQLERGAVATPFEFRPFSTELELCQRYYEKSYAASVTPGTSTTAGLTALEVLADGTLTRLKLFRSGFAVHKRVSPDIKWYSETGTADSISVYSDSATTKTVSSTTGTINSSVGYYVTVSTNAVAAQTYVGHWTASAEL